MIDRFEIVTMAAALIFFATCLGWAGLGLL